ncbi:nicotinamide riboside transporter PnuC [Aquabacterium sp. A7-Y]|uniref:nicotinamide riboside transporter PnuC n=1 Tax=Aquabacterium sp. A7-Y TaxID=1349605 RepID=UPI00223CFD99|nr:nicotinamide riboside transporter PnuC [Aquabacterium sp. A7-Y]MCW7537604.1 nicotinamide riboside transporter PnuC [Aquabacterium sp. A7-Y]
MDSLLAAAAPLMVSAFTLWGAPVTRLEIVAFVLSVAMVACNIRVIPWGWPLAIVSSLLYYLLFWKYGLYGDAVLQLFFVVVAFWGWWQWLRGRRGDGSPLRVHSMSWAGRARVALCVAAGWPLLGLYLDRYTDSTVPYWDAFPTVASIAGQFLLGRKLVENWPTWIIVNTVCVALFAYKALWLTVLLYLLFIAMAAVGWRAWRRLAAEAS